MERYSNLGFRWTSDTKDSARISSEREKASIKDGKIGETIVTFADGGPKQIQLSIFNRGDDGPMNADKFNGELQKWNKILSGITSVKPERKARDNKSAVKTKGVVWNTGDLAYLLEYSSQGRGDSFRGEFIRLRMAPLVKKSFMEEKLSGPKKRVKKADLPANVVREDGDVYIKGIPMVDQGQKGYCVVAATARMFGYYGLQVDQHEIAQMANSSASGGTNTDAMIDALKGIAGRFKMRIKTHDDMSYQDMCDLSEDYNRIAKRGDKSKMVKTGNNVNNWYNFDDFDPEILKSTRLKSTSGIKKFEAEVKRSIDAGIPLLWTVTVGIYKEPVRISQSRGGHMRMIIGYNTAKKEIIFSDTWGAGHEKKNWGIEEAYCSTKGIYSIQPTM